MIFEKHSQSQQMGQAWALPKLSAGAQTPLELKAQRFNGSTAARSSASFPALVVQMILVLLKIADLPLQHLPLGRAQAPAF